MASPSSKLGVCNRLPALISRTGKATDFKFGGYIYMTILNRSPLKILRKWSMDVSRGCPNFLRSPILSRKRVKVRTTNMASTFTGPIRIKAHKKILEKRERGRIQWLPNFFGYPLLSQERVKLRTSNFVGSFIWWIGTKAHEKFWE